MTDSSFNEVGGGAGFRGAAPVSFTLAQVRDIFTFGVGNEGGRTVPATELWEIIYVAITMNTSAVVANRYPYIAILDGVGNDKLLIPMQWPPMTAGNNWRWNWLLGWNRDTEPTPPFTLSSIPTYPSNLPDKLFADAGDQVRMKCANLQATDEITSFIVTYRKFSARSKKLTLL